MNIRERLKALGKTQVWLIRELQNYNISVPTSEMSYILSGVLTTPKAKRVLNLCDTILKEYESEVEKDAENTTESVAN